MHGVEEKQLTNNLSNIEKDLISKFDSDQNSARTQKDVDKRKTKMATSSPSLGLAREVNLTKQRMTLKNYPEIYTTSHSRENTQGHPIGTQEIHSWSLATYTISLLGRPRLYQLQTILLTICVIVKFNTHARSTTIIVTNPCIHDCHQIIIALELVRASKNSKEGCHTEKHIIHPDDPEQAVRIGVSLSEETKAKLVTLLK